MDKEYIERGALLVTYRKWLPQLVSEEDEGDRRGVETCIAVLEQVNAADVAEVKHGRWERRPLEEVSLNGLFYKCSLCGKTTRYDLWNYCPNCGAKMDGGI